jgi:hypothetical protein
MMRNHHICPRIVVFSKLPCCPPKRECRRFPTKIVKTGCVPQSAFERQIFVRMSFMLTALKI